MFTKNATYTLSTNECIELNKLMASRRGKTDNDLLHQVIAIGLYHLNYRDTRNKVKKENEARGRMIAELVNSGKLTTNAMREIGIKLGMVVDNEMEGDDIISVE